MNKKLKPQASYNVQDKPKRHLNEDVLRTIIIQLHASMPTHLRNEKGAMAMLRDIGPQDALEGALAAQMIAVHHASLDMLGRAMIDGQTVDGVTQNINRAVKLCRTFTTQMETLQKYRAKGQQTIQVQHVQVNEGGQAIVGNVNTKGGGGNG